MRSALSDSFEYSDRISADSPDQLGQSAHRTATVLREGRSPGRGVIATLALAAAAESLTTAGFNSSVVADGWAFRQVRLA